MEKLLAIFLSLQFMLPIVTTHTWYNTNYENPSETFLKNSDPDYYLKLSVGTLWEQKLSSIESKNTKSPEPPCYSHNEFEREYNLPPGGLSLDTLNLTKNEKSKLSSLRDSFENYRKSLVYSQEAHEKNELRVSLFYQILKTMELEVPGTGQEFSLLADGVSKLTGGTCLDFTSLLAQEAKKQDIHMYPAMTLESIDENKEIASNHAFNIFISNNKEAFVSDLTYAVCEQQDGNSVCFLVPLKNYIDSEFYSKHRTIDSYNIFVNNRIIPLPQFLHQKGIIIK